MEYSNKTRTVTAYCRDISKGTINFDHKVQRKNNQWNKQQKNKLILTMLKGDMPIPPIHVMSEDDILWVIDGKQRLTTIKEFIDDEFALDKSTQPAKINVAKINGELNGELNGEKVELAKKKFSELPEELQARIKDTEIVQVKYVDYSDEQIADIYMALNNGTPLSADQKLRAALPADVLQAIDDVLDSPLFEKTNLTAGQIRKGEDLAVILKAAMLISGREFTGFGGDEMIAFAEDCDISLIQRLREACDRLNDVVPEKQKYLKKISLPMIIAVATENMKDMGKFWKKLDKFFEGYEDDDEYKQYCQGATASKQNVLGRWEYFRKL